MSKFEVSINETINKLNLLDRFLTILESLGNKEAVETLDNFITFASEFKEDIKNKTIEEILKIKHKEKIFKTTQNLLTSLKNDMGEEALEETFKWITNKDLSDTIGFAFLLKSIRENLDLVEFEEEKFDIPEHFSNRTVKRWGEKYVRDKISRL